MDYRVYNARTHFIVAVIILIIVVIIAAAVAAVLYRMVRESVREGRRVHRILTFITRQDNAIVNTITEIESAPSTYAGFPQALIAELMALHQEFPSAITGRIKREID